MHPFCIDSPERRDVTLFLALLSVILTMSIDRVVNHLTVSFPWWFDKPSVMVFFGILYELFNKYLWRWDLLRKIGVVKTPDLNGSWDAEIKSSFDGYAGSHTGSVIIRQTWTRISINMMTARSNSHSFAAALMVNQLGGDMLCYEYQNNPDPIVEPSMHIHIGTAILGLIGPDCMQGYYYSGRDRETHGSLSLRKIIEGR